MRLYHRTPAGTAILREGFRDATGSYMFVGITLTGVWLSDEPLTANEGAKGDDLIEVIMPDRVDMSVFEIVEEGKPYREWCAPAALINEHGTLRLVSEDEQDEIWWLQKEAMFAAQPELLADLLNDLGDQASLRLVEIARKLGIGIAP